MRINAFTPKGRLEVAKFNGLLKEWTNIVKDHNDDTTIVKMNWDLAILIHGEHGQKKRQIQKTHFPALEILGGALEGKHRTSCAISCALGTPIDPLTGAVSAPGLLKYKHFADAEVINRKDVPQEDNLQTVIEAVLSGNGDLFPEEKYDFDKACKGLTTEFTMQIEWATGDDDIAVVLDAQRTRSRMISNSKIGSVRKPAHTTIGYMGQHAVHEINKDNMNFRPDTSIMKGPSNTWKETTWLTKTKVRDEIGAHNKKIIEKQGLASEAEMEWEDDWEMAGAGIWPKLFSPEFMAYAQDPNDPDIEEAWLDLNSYYAISDATDGSDDSKLRPPFLNSYKSLSLDRGDVNVTTANINFCTYLPKVLHALYADENNTTTEDITDDPKVRDLVLYTARYHGNSSGMTSMKCHGIMHERYDTLTYSEFALDQPNGIIGAAIAITNALNICLTDPSMWYQDGLTLEDDERHNRLRVQGDNFATMFCTIRSRSGLVTPKEFIQTMGKFILSFIHDFIFTGIKNTICFFFSFTPDDSVGISLSSQEYHFKKMQA